MGREIWARSSFCRPEMGVPKDRLLSLASAPQPLAWEQWHLELERKSPVGSRHRLG